VRVERRRRPSRGSTARRRSISARDTKFHNKFHSKENTMTKLTRRSLLQKTPATAAMLSLLPGLPADAAIRRSRQAAASRPAAASAGSMVIHVNDVATGAMTILVGAREIRLRDPRLVARFVEAAG
jgi:hypothetical protein